MSTERRDLDDLLRRNTEQQLADFDWDRSRARILGRLTMAGGRAVSKRPSRAAVVGATLAAAAVLMLVAAGLCLYLSGESERDPVQPAYVGADALLASTDPETILPMGRGRLLTLNDPSLKPHSLWDQPTVEESNRNQRMENDHDDQDI